LSEFDRKQVNCGGQQVTGRDERVETPKADEIYHTDRAPVL